MREIKDDKDLGLNLYIAREIIYKAVECLGLSRFAINEDEYNKFEREILNLLAEFEAKLTNAGYEQHKTEINSILNKLLQERIITKKQKNIIEMEDNI